MKEILLVFSPGARGNFLNSFLTDFITESAFEFSNATYIHTWQLKVEDNRFVQYAHKNFTEHHISDDCFIVNTYVTDQYIKIFIDLDILKLDRWLYLFYKKNIVVQDSSFSNLLEEHTFDKLYRAIHYELDLCKNIDHNIFDYVVPFSKLYDWDYLNNLKFNISGTHSNKKEIVDKTNYLNDVDDIHFKTIVDLAINIDPDEILPYKLYDRYLEIVT
jgi:hypothetical protein